MGFVQRFRQVQKCLVYHNTCVRPGSKYLFMRKFITLQHWKSNSINTLLYKRDQELKRSFAICCMSLPCNSVDVLLFIKRYQSCSRGTSCHKSEGYKKNLNLARESDFRDLYNSHLLRLEIDLSRKQLILFLLLSNIFLVTIWNVYVT